jgi:hypothetical protein
MGDHHPDYDGLANDEHLLTENDNQGLETASTLGGVTNNGGLTRPIELDEDEASEYFNSQAIERANNGGNHESGPFDDPLLSSTSGGDGTDGLESGTGLDVEYDHSTHESELMHDFTAETSTGIGREGVGGGDGVTNGLGLLHGDGAISKNIATLSHRHELHDRPSTSTEGHSFVGGLIWALVVVHILLLIALIAAWWRQKRSKDPTMRSFTPGPPQKVGCSYDMDKSYSLPKIELGNLPIKALKTLKQAKA